MPSYDSAIWVKLSQAEFCKLFAHSTGCVSESGNFKNVMKSKGFHLFSFNTYEHNVYIKEFKLFQFNTFNNLTH